MDVQALQPGQDSWFTRNSWKFGFLFAALLGGFWWSRFHRVQNINVGSVSERWLAEQAFEAGQRSSE